MQVAKQNMPVSSIVIGVDLFPIKTVAGCISLVEDITTDKCKQALTRELQSWKADVVLHDGAPNVGKNWLYDAYQQICLTLNAVKLATHFLRGGGWFITKVFRSKDYNALLWVLKQLFKKVHATKPSASRKESAEIFVVCQYFIAPERIDPKLLDPKYVFEELDLEAKKPVSLLHPDQKRIKAEGYTEKDLSLRSVLKVSEFMKHSSGLTALQGIGEIEFDDAAIEAHPKTTAEIRECCKDIKLLGRKDMRHLLNWWKLLHAELYPDVKRKEKEEAAEAEAAAAAVVKKDLTKEDIEDMEFEELERHIAELEAEGSKDDKRKKKRVQKARAKLNERLNLKMVIKGDAGPQEEDTEVFSLRQITSQMQLDELQDVTPDQVLEGSDNDADEFRPKFKRFTKGETVIDDDGAYHDDAADELEGESGAESDSDDDSERLGRIGLGLGGSDNSDNETGDDRRKVRGKKKLREATAAAAAAAKRDENPLLTDLDTRDKDTKRQQRVQLWFEKDALQGVDDDVDEDHDLDKLAGQYKQKGVRVLGEDRSANVAAAAPHGKSAAAPAAELFLGKKAKRRARHGAKDDNSSSDDDDDSDDEAELAASTSTAKRVGGADGFDVVTQTKPKKIKLNEEELALGALMVQDRKSRRDLVESAWNRYAFNDENLPEWFVNDELVNMRKETPVPPELADEYRKKLDELNVRPIKKVMEAKARKKRRALKRFEKAKKKAEAVLENADSSAQEKMRQIKK